MIMSVCLSVCLAVAKSPSRQVAKAPRQATWRKGGFTVGGGRFIQLQKTGLRWKAHLFSLSAVFGRLGGAVLEVFAAVLGLFGVSLERLGGVLHAPKFSF